MKAIIWKELRENSKWALLGFAIFGIALANAWLNITDPSNFGSSDRNYDSILSYTVLQAIWIVSAIVGGALGFLQIMPEQKRDRWAFLVHRPVSLETIFWGKIVAGATLYFGATLIPFMVLYWVASSSEAIPAPFDPRMALAGLADIFAGFIVYLAALISSLRTGRWLGSKLLVIAGTVIVSGVIFNRTEFLYSTLWFIAYSGIFLIAARAMMTHQGLWNPIGKIAKISFFIIVLLGCVQILYWSVGYIIISVSHRTGYGNDTTQNYILRDGTPVLVENKNGVHVKVTTLDGKELPFTREQLANIYSLALRQLPLLSIRYISQIPGYREINRYVIPLAYNASQEGTWYYSLLHRQFMNYSRDTRLRGCQGILTPSGFIAHGMTSDSSFPDVYPSLRSSSTINMTPIFNNEVYYIDTLNLAVNRIYTAAEARDIYAASTFSPSPSDALDRKSYIVICSPSGTVVMDLKMNPVINFPWKHDKKIWSGVAMGIMQDESAWFVTSSPNSDAQSKNNWKFPVIIDKYSPQGQWVKSWEFQPQREYANPLPPWYYYGFGINIPLGWEAWDYSSNWAGAKLKIPMCEQIWQFQKSRWKYERPVCGFSLLGSVLAVITAFGVLRRKGIAGATTLAWLIVVFITGIAGFLAMIAVPEFPVRIPCPACGAKRRTEEETCPRCAAAWPVPARDGTEIFVSK